jgi:PAS domain S-box-containing protein
LIAKNNLNKTGSYSLRLRYESALAELEKYKILVESVQDYAIFLMDTEGHIQTWNKGAQRIKGYAPKEIIGKHFSNFYAEQDKVAKKPERELVIAKKIGRVEDEDWRVRKDGTQFWANVVITALYDRDDVHVGFAKVTRDLTERKRNEEELRTANTQLKQQQRELQQLNVYKDEFISLASHQLRTPATIVKQFLGLILEGFEGELSPAQQQMILKAYESNDRQIQIVNDLLRVAQLDAGKIVLKKTPVQLNKFVQEIILDQEETFRKRHQTMELNLQNKEIVADIDAGHFRMALENILDNASKYTPENGSIRIVLSEDNGLFDIFVEDSGVGIEQKDIGKLFDKFSRIHNSLSDKVGGSGLGLYWVEKIIELHGGKVNVQSKINKGTSFNVHVPIK